MDGTVEVRFFGNGKRMITPNWLHAVRTKEYHNLDTPNGKLPANKDYVLTGFINRPLVTEGVIRIGQGKYTTINVKCLDYVRPLRAK